VGGAYLYLSASQHNAGEKALAGVETLTKETWQPILERHSKKLQKLSEYKMGRKTKETLQDSSVGKDHLSLPSLHRFSKFPGEKKVKYRKREEEARH